MQKNRIKRGFSPLYLAILSGILLVILIINGMLEINRTRNGFHLLLEREATVLLQHYEKNIQETLSNLQLLEKLPPDLPPSQLSSLYGLEESIAEYLVEAAHRIDQADREKPLSPEDLHSLASQYLLTSIEIYDPRGRLIKGWPPSPLPGHRPFLRELIEKRRSVVIDLFGKPLAGEGQWFSIAIWRKGGSGIISLQLDSGQMRKLLYQFALQRAISDIGFREGVLYVSVQDVQFNIVAHTDSGLIGKREEDSFLKNMLQNPKPLSRLRKPSKEEDIFEVAKSFSFREKAHGYHPHRVLPEGNPFYSQTDRKNGGPLHLLLSHLRDLRHRFDLDQSKSPSPKDQRDGRPGPVGGTALFPRPPGCGGGPRDPQPS